MKVITTILLLLFSNLIFAQSFTYRMPRVTDEFSGPIKNDTVFVYDKVREGYRFNNQLTYDRVPESSYHFNDEKWLLERNSYSRIDRSRKEKYVHNDEGNLRYAIAGKMDNSFLQMETDTFTAQFVLNENKIYQVEGVSFEEYQYDYDNKMLSISHKDGFRMPSRLYFDEKSRSVKIENYVHEKGQNYLRTRIRTFENDLLVEDVNASKRSNYSFKHQYNSAGEIIKTDRFSDGQLISTTEFTFPKPGEKHVHLKNHRRDKNEFHIELTFQATTEDEILEVDYTEEWDDDIKLIIFKDHFGNTIKKYRIDDGSSAFHITERHIDYFKDGAGIDN